MTQSNSHSRKKLIICISGMAGCGKSTVAKKIAKKYNLHHFSGGSALKALALEAGFKPVKRGWWESEEGMKFLKKRMQASSFDQRVDEMMLKQAKNGDVVFDSWTMPWLLETGFKIWLEATPKERAKRIARRDGIDIRKALTALKEKDSRSKAIYKKLYGFNLGEDFSPFDLILDVNQLSSEEVFRTLILAIDRLLLKT